MITQNIICTSYFTESEINKLFDKIEKTLEAWGKGGSLKFYFNKIEYYFDDKEDELEEDELKALQNIDYNTYFRTIEDSDEARELVNELEMCRDYFEHKLTDSAGRKLYLTTQTVDCREIWVVEDEEHNNIIIEKEVA